MGSRTIRRRTVQFIGSVPLAWMKRAWGLGESPTIVGQELWRRKVYGQRILRIPYRELRSHGFSHCTVRRASNALYDAGLIDYSWKGLRIDKLDINNDWVSKLFVPKMPRAWANLAWTCGGVSTIVAQYLWFRDSADRNDLARSKPLYDGLLKIAPNIAITKRQFLSAVSRLAAKRLLMKTSEPGEMLEVKLLKDASKLGLPN